VPTTSRHWPYKSHDTQIAEEEISFTRLRERCDVMANRSDREQGQPTKCRRRHSLISRMGPCSRTPSGPAVSIDCINRPDRRLHPTHRHYVNLSLATRGPSTEDMWAFARAERGWTQCTSSKACTRLAYSQGSQGAGGCGVVASLAVSDSRCEGLHDPDLTVLDCEPFFWRHSHSHSRGYPSR